MLSLFHVLWLMNVFDYIFKYIVYLASYIYMRIFSFTGERGASLEALERRGVGEDQAWINHQ